MSEFSAEGARIRDAEHSVRLIGCDRDCRPRRILFRRGGPVVHTNLCQWRTAVADEMHRLADCVGQGGDLEAILAKLRATSSAPPLQPDPNLIVWSRR